MLESEDEVVALSVALVPVLKVDSLPIARPLHRAMAFLLGLSVPSALAVSRGATACITPR